MARNAHSHLEKVEELLEESAEELYEDAPCGYISTLPDGTLLKANRTFLAWTANTRDALLEARRFQDLLTMPGRIYYETHFAPLLQMQGEVQEIAFDLVRPDRTPLPVLVNARMLRDESDQPLLIRITLINATDRRAYERELLLARRKADQLARARADLLSMISHDIRGPLSAIVSGVAILEKLGPSPQQEKYLKMVRSSSEHLVSLVNNILDLSQIEAGAMSLEAKEFELRELLHNVLESLHARAEEKGLPLRLEMDEPALPVLLGDPLKLGQVLSNLLTNAIKFTQTGEVLLAIQVVARAPDSVSLMFRVADTGIGIPPDRLAHIFDEFTQASSDIREKYGGSGLGLSISRRLLELYGSKLHVESIQGRGSTFSFELTLKTAP